MFIGVQDLKENSVIEDNVDEKILAISIKEFQELEIKKILGRSEYERLSDELLKVVNEVGYELSESDVLLMDVITPVMIYGALTYSISPLHYKLSNMGVKNETNINSLSTEQATIRANYAFKLDGFRAELKEYISTPSCCASPDDTTYNMTGVSLDDYTPDREERYRDYYYGTHRRRR